MEKQKVQSRNRGFLLLFLIMFTSLGSDFFIASQEDSLRINNKSYLLQNLDSIELNDCISNLIKKPDKYVLKCSKGLEITPNKDFNFIEAVKDSDYPKYITLRKRFSFKRRKIFVSLVNPPKPRMTISYNDLEKDNSLNILLKDNYLYCKIPWNNNDSALAYRLQEYEIVINEGLSVRTSNRLFKLINADEIKSIELKNIKYQVGSCYNNDFGESIRFQ